MCEKIMYYANLVDEVSWMAGHLFRFDIKMQEKVDVVALQKAVERTKACYVCLQIEPKLHNERIAYFENTKPVVLRQIPYSAPVSIGKADTNGYPWSISYCENTITCAFHHGLVDGKAAIEIMRTLLYEYSIACGISVAEKEDIYTAEEPIPTEIQMADHYEEASKMEACSAVPPKQSEQELDMIKKEYLNNGEMKLVRLVFDVEPFLAYVKEMNTTPFALIAVLLFEGMRPLTDKDSPNMEGSVVTNLRPIINLQTMRNCVKSPTVYYDTQKMDRLNPDMKCTELRTQVNMTLDKDLIITELQGSWKNWGKLITLPYSMRKQVLSSSISFSPTQALSLSYVGNLELPAEVKEQIADIQMSVSTGSSETVSNHTRPLGVECYSLNEKMICNTYINLNTLAPLEYVRDFLNQHGFSCVMEAAKPLPELYYTDDIF